MTKQLVPGSYVETSKDAGGSPILTKVPHTREWMESHYEMVDFCPPRTGPVNVNGVGYNLVARQHVKVPSIIRDVLLQSIASDADRPKPWTADEDDVIVRGAVDNPGKKYYSRLAPVGYGLFRPDHISNERWSKSRNAGWDQREVSKVLAEREAERPRTALGAMLVRLAKRVG